MTTLSSAYGYKVYGDTRTAANFMEEVLKKMEETTIYYKEEAGIIVLYSIKVLRARIAETIFHKEGICSWV